MDAKSNKNRAAIHPIASITQAIQIQHVPHTEFQTTPLTTICNKLISTSYEIPNKYTRRTNRRLQAQHKPHECNMSRTHTNAETTHNNLQQIDAGETRDSKNGRGEKKSWNRDKPENKHNNSHTNATCHAYPNADQTAQSNLQQIDISDT